MKIWFAAVCCSVASAVAASYDLPIIWTSTLGTNFDFRIYASTNNLNFTWVQTSPNSLSCVLTNLSQGISNYVYVTGFNRSNNVEGLPSNILTNYAVDPATLPQAPSNLKLGLATVHTNTLVPGTNVVSFTNVAQIKIPDVGTATPYPSLINVSNLLGTVKSVTVQLTGMTHTWTDDVDVMLVGPTGVKTMIMSDVGPGPASNVTLTFSDSAAAVLPQKLLVSGTYRPTDYTDSSAGADNFPGAPAGTMNVGLGLFNGLDPNGTWRLYVQDDGAGDLGTISGWKMTITTTVP
jgi:subtilisin-like proprotein convertase family protein